MTASSGPTPLGWHQIVDYIRCPKLFQFRHVRGLKAPQHEEPDYFAIGILFHAARAVWFERKFARDEATWGAMQDAVQQAAEVNRLPVRLEAQQMALRIAQDYVEHYSQRPVPTVTYVEQLLGPTRIGEDEGTERTARIDDASRYFEAGGMLCIGEAKTTGASVGDTVNEYTLHGQPLLQALLWKLAPQGEAMHGPIAGVMLDVVRKPRGTGKCEFGRRLVPISDWSLDWYAKTLAKAVLRSKRVTETSDEERRITACTYQAGAARVSCEFRSLCMHGADATTEYLKGTTFMEADDAI